MDNYKEVEQEENFPLQHSSKKKYILIAVIIAVILGGGILWYLQGARQESGGAVEDTSMETGKVSENTIENEILDWKDYINEFDGFSIKYPPDWHLVTYQLGDLGIPASIEIRPFGTPGREGGNGLIISAVSFEKTLDEAQQEFAPTPLSEENKKLMTVAIEDVSFHGELAKHIDVSYTVGTPARNATVILVKHNGKLYTLGYAQTTIDGAFSDTVEKMLTTFQFGNAPLEKFSLIHTDLKTGGVKNRLRTVARGLDLYFLDRGFYPKADKEKVYNLTRENVSSRGGVLRILVEDGYISHIPDLSNLSEATFYEYTSDGITYELAVQLDNNLDPQCIVEQDVCIYRIRDGRVVSNK